MTNLTGPPISPEIASTLISAILAALIAAVVSWAVSRNALRAHERGAINNMIDKTIMVAIKYPYLEDDAFCESWPEIDRTSEKAMRYENYCCLVFNLIERVWKFCKGSDREVEKMFYAREMVYRHRRWWEGDPENLHGYDARFQRYISRILTGDSTNESASNSD